MKLEKVQKKLTKLSPSWVGEKKSVPSIIRGLNATFKKSIVRFASSRYEQEYFKNHSVIVSGQYSPRIIYAIAENILITLSFPKEPKTVTITDKEAENMVLRIARAIHHEYRHKKQQNGRGYVHTRQYTPKKDSKNKFKETYYGNPDEIDAHAYETQAESLNINNLRFAHKINWRESEAIFMYRSCFRNKDPKIWKRFLKKVYKLNAAVQAIPDGRGKGKSHK